MVYCCFSCTFISLQLNLVHMSPSRQRSSHAQNSTTSIITSPRMLRGGADGVMVGHSSDTVRVVLRAGRQQTGRPVSGDAGHWPQTRHRWPAIVVQLPSCSARGWASWYVWPSRAQFTACHVERVHWNNITSSHNLSLISSQLLCPHPTTCTSDSTGLPSTLCTI